MDHLMKLQNRAGDIIDPATDGPAGMTITQTVVTLSAATSAQLIAYNSKRKFLAWMNVGLNPATVVPGASAAVAGQGMNYDPGATTGNQGGSRTFDGSSAPINAFQAISTLGTTIVVWEGQ